MARCSQVSCEWQAQQPNSLFNRITTERLLLSLGYFLISLSPHFLSISLSSHQFAQVSSPLFVILTQSHTCHVGCHLQRSFAAEADKEKRLVTGKSHACLWYKLYRASKAVSQERVRTYWWWQILNSEQLCSNLFIVYCLFIFCFVNINIISIYTSLKHLYRYGDFWQWQKKLQVRYQCFIMYDSNTTKLCLQKKWVSEFIHIIIHGGLTGSPGRHKVRFYWYSRGLVSTGRFGSVAPSRGLCFHSSGSRESGLQQKLCHQNTQKSL